MRKRRTLLVDMRPDGARDRACGAGNLPTRSNTEASVMTRTRQSIALAWLAAALVACASSVAWGQTPGQPAVAGTYEGSMRMQRESDAEAQRSRDQQRQQQQQQQVHQDWNASVQRNQAQQNAAAAQGQDVLRTWQKRPPLPPDHNPLIGRWEAKVSGPPTKTSGGDDMASLARSLLGGMTSAMCDNMVGHGTIDFRPDVVVTIGADGRERVLYHAEYRGGGTRVVVLPKDAGTFTHMIIDFDRPDHGVVAAVGCVLTRPGTGAAASGAGPVRADPNAKLLRPAVANTGQQPLATLQLTAGVTLSPGQYTPATGKEVWLLRGSADMALIHAGFTSSSNASVMHNFMVACQQHRPACDKGFNALRANTASLIKTEQRGSQH